MQNQIAACRYCGQVQTMDAEECIDLNLEEITDLATSRCECDEAVKFQERRQYFERAKATISKMFPEEYLRNTLLGGVEQLYFNGICSMAINIDGENTVKIAKTSKGLIYVEKKFSTGNKVEL